MDRVQPETFVITHHSTTAVVNRKRKRRDSVDTDHHQQSMRWSRSSCWSTAMDRRRKSLVRLMIVAMLALIFSIDGGTGVGRVEASVASSQGRSVVYGRVDGRGGRGHPSVWRWRRTMKTTMPDEQETRIMNFLAGGGGGGGGVGSPIKHSSQMRRWGNGEGNPLLFLGHDGQPPPSASQFLQSSDSPKDERQNSNAFGNTRHRPISAFFNPPQPFWNLDGPRRHRSLTGNPESRPSYLALDENPFSSFRDAGGERQLMSIGARRILVDPREEGEAWRRPTQKFWRRLRSLNDKSQIDYMLNAKRQPPPGFHAIRGKRQSESDGEGRREQEEDEEDEEEEEEADAEELKRWMMHKVSGRIRHEML